MFTIDTTVADLSTVYAAADVSEKASIRSAHRDALKAAVDAGDLPLAQHIMGLESALKSAPRSTATEIDWVARTRDLRATLVAAIDMIDNGDVTFPESVTFTLPADADLTGGEADMDHARKLAAVSGRKGKRGSVVGYIDSVLGNEPMTVAQLRAAWEPSTDYPKSAPSAGALSAALNRPSIAEAGIVPMYVAGVLAATRA